jgi:precorrin-6B methylase 1
MQHLQHYHHRLLLLRPRNVEVEEETSKLTKLGLNDSASVRLAEDVTHQSENWAHVS